MIAPVPSDKNFRSAVEDPRLMSARRQVMRKDRKIAFKETFHFGGICI
jgi:hypothetical protein